MILSVNCSRFDRHSIARVRAIVKINLWGTIVSVIVLIKYDKLWRTMKDKGITQYALIHQYKISTGQLDRLRKNAPLSTNTLNTLCLILNCDLSDIASFEKSDDDFI